MELFSKKFKRFVTSGQLDTAGIKQILGITVNSLSADATVNVYDGPGTTVADRFFGSHLQPGTTQFFPIRHITRNEVYVEMPATAEVFVYYN